MTFEDIGTIRVVSRVALAASGFPGALLAADFCLRNTTVLSKLILLFAMKALVNLEINHENLWRQYNLKRSPGMYLLRQIN